MTSRDLGEVDRALDALDPGRALAAKGTPLAARGVGARLSEVDSVLAELEADLGSGSTFVPSLPPGTPTERPSAPSTPPAVAAPKTIDRGVDPELSFDDLFEDVVPDVEAASKPLTAIPPAPTKPAIAGKDLDDRLTMDLEPEEIAALDSLEILVDD